MALLAKSSPRRKQPTGMFKVDWRNELTQGLTHLWCGGSWTNAVDGQLVTSNYSTPKVAVTGGGIALWNSNTGLQGFSVPANATQINLRNPWTIGMLVEIDSTITQVGAANNNGIIGIGNTAGALSGTYDRVIAPAAASGGSVAWGSYLFDGASEVLTGSSFLSKYSTNPSVSAVVVTAHDLGMHLFVNGTEDASSPLTITNNGFNSYTVGSCFFNWGNCANSTLGGYKILMCFKTDNAGWDKTRAAKWWQNPWQMFE